MADQIVVQEFSRSFPINSTGDGTERTDILATYQVFNRTWRTIAAVSMLVTAVCVCALYKLAVRPPERVIVRVNENGEITLSQSLDTYKPRERDLIRDLTNFIQWHYGRVRATAVRDYEKSLVFMAPELRQRVADEEARTKARALWLSKPEPDVEVYVTNVVFNELDKPPYKVTVHFDKVVRDGVRERRSRYIASCIFAISAEPPERWALQINPLGLLITNVREDPSFIN